MLASMCGDHCVVWSPFLNQQTYEKAELEAESYNLTKQNKRQNDPLTKIEKAELIHSCRDKKEIDVICHIG